VELPGKRRIAGGPIPPGPDDLLYLTDEQLDGMTLPELKALIPTLVLDIDPEDVIDREEALAFLRSNSH
jgi:hypothetical protein